MGITVRWDDEDNYIIIFTFVGKWTWEEYLNACQLANEMHATVTHRVYVIGDLTESSGIPVGAGSYFMRSLAITPPNAGKRIAVNGGKVIEILIKTFKRLYRPLADEFDTAPTLEAARHLLRYRIEADRRSRENKSQEGRDMTYGTSIDAP